MNVHAYFVQRASLSFWRFLAGLDFQSSGVSPSLIVSLSSREMCCLGADTIVASMICPPWRDSPCCSRTHQTDQTALPPRPPWPAPRDKATKSWRREPHPPAAHEGEAITKLVYRLIVGEIVERLQHQCLEDHDFIPRLASRRILAFRFARDHRRKLQADRSFR
jgi:hypothetical protein